LNEKVPNDFGGSMARMVSVLSSEGAARLFKQGIVKCARIVRKLARVSKCLNFGGLHLKAILKMSSKNAG
jgi:hypothetical protein